MPTQKQLQEQIEKLESGQAITQAFAKAIINGLNQRVKTFEKEVKELKSKIDVLEKANSIYEKKIGELENKFNQLLDENIKQKEKFELLNNGISEIIGHDMGFLNAPPMKLSEKIDYLKDMNKGKFEKITELVTQNQNLKERLGIVDSKWQFEVDLAWRHNPQTGDFEQFGFPSPFIFGNVENFHFKDKSKEMCHFRYRHEADIYKEYDMPYSLFNVLKKKTPDRKDSKKEKIDIHEIQNEDDLKHYFLSKGGNLRGKYPSKVIKFIIKTRGNKFDIREFDKYCGFKDNRESRRQYIKKLIDWDLIEQTNKQGVCQNLI